MNGRRNSTLHTCNAAGCGERIPVSQFMCRLHLALVPSSVRTTLIRQYRDGQDIDGVQTPEYTVAAAEAIRTVSERLGKTSDAPEATLPLAEILAQATAQSAVGQYSTLTRAMMDIYALAQVGDNPYACAAWKMILPVLESMCVGAPAPIVTFVNKENESLVPMPFQGGLHTPFFSTAIPEDSSWNGGSDVCKN